jgi:hypothetical protein
MNMTDCSTKYHMIFLEESIVQHFIGSISNKHSNLNLD